VRLESLEKWTLPKAEVDVLYDLPLFFFPFLVLDFSPFGGLSSSIIASDEFEIDDKFAPEDSETVIFCTGGKVLGIFLLAAACRSRFFFLLILFLTERFEISRFVNSAAFIASSTVMFGFVNSMKAALKTRADPRASH